MALRDLRADELGDLLESGKLQTKGGLPGIGGFITRWLAKNLSSNPKQARLFLERQGYKVTAATSGSKLNFLIEKPSDPGFGQRVLDPAGFDMQDLTDIAGDVLRVVAEGLGITAGATLGATAGTAAGPGGTVGGGLLGGAAGGAFVGGAFETGRQSLGVLAGVNQEADLGRIAAETTAAGLAAPTGAVASKVGGAVVRGALRAGKKLSVGGLNLTQNLMARLIGVTEDQFKAATRNPKVAAELIAEKSPRINDILERLRGFLFKNNIDRMPEFHAINKLLDNGRPVNMASLIDQLMGVGQKSPVGPLQKAAAKEGRDFAEDLAVRLTGASGEKGIALARNTNVTSRQAMEFKRLLQAEADFSGRPSDDPASKFFKTLARQWQNKVVAGLSNSAMRAEFRRLNGVATKIGFGPGGVPTTVKGHGLAEKMAIRNELNRKITEFKSGGQENFLKNVFNAGKSDDRALIQRFDKEFGDEFQALYKTEARLTENLQTAAIADRFASDAPPLTAMGKFRGVSLGTGALGGAGLGGAVGGPVGGAVGGVAGAVAGFAAASPKGGVRIGRGAMRAGEGLRRLVRSGGQAAQRATPFTNQVNRFAAAFALQPSHQPEQERAFPKTAPIGIADDQATFLKGVQDRVNAIPNLTAAQRQQVATEILNQRGQIEPPAPPKLPPSIPVLAPSHKVDNGQGRNNN